MDFGKKGDAKKALKLAWKDHRGKGPLTSAELKIAWKKVHGPKKNTSNKRVKNSPKKVLKLAWKNHKGKGPLTSAELKRAWKKTMRFGDTVCPPGEEPNTWYTGGKEQRQCINECKFFQKRNPATNRCKNMVIAAVEDQVVMHVPPSTMPPQGPAAARVLPPGYEINPATGRRRKMCVDPEVRNAKGRCVAPRVVPVLQPGYEINPATGRRRKMCNQDEYRDPATQRCRKLQFSVQPLIWPTERSAAGPLIDFSSFGRRNRYGGRKCGFGSCTACNMK